MLVRDPGSFSETELGATQWVAPTDRHKQVIPTAGSQRGSIGAYKMSVTRKIAAKYNGVLDLW